MQVDSADGGKAKKAAKETSKETPEDAVDIGENDDDKDGSDTVHHQRPSDHWTYECLNPRKRLELTRNSPEFDKSEDYWKFMLVVQALRYCERIEEAEKKAQEAPHIDLEADHSDEDDINKNRDINQEAITAKVDTKSNNEDSDHTNDDVSQNAGTQNDVVANTESKSRKKRRKHQSKTSKIIAEQADIYNPLKYIDKIELEDYISKHHIIPTKENVRKVRRVQKWLDNQNYQRENHEEACGALGIKDPVSPRLSSMVRSAVFKFWQPVAINAIRHFDEETSLRGVILADSVGLGKTWETIGFILYVSDVDSVEKGFSRLIKGSVGRNTMHMWRRSLRKPKTHRRSQNSLQGSHS